MKDYLCKFADEAEALADPVVGAYAVDGAWRTDTTFTTTVTDRASGQLLPYFYLIVSDVDGRDDLRDHPACVLAVDWDGPTVIGAQFPAGTGLADYTVSPMPLGRDFAALGANL